MIRLRIATPDGFQELTPATLSRCGFTDGCRHASYVDGPADADPYYHCNLYDQRTDGKRLPQCIAATNPVIVESLRGKAERYGSHPQVEVQFPRPQTRPAQDFDPKEHFVCHTLRFKRERCICDMHGTFLAALLPGEKPWCPSCIQAWLDEMRAVLCRILARALAHLHRERMDAEHGALRVGRLPASMLYPGAEWTVLGENPSWNPTKE